MLITAMSYKRKFLHIIMQSPFETLARKMTDLTGDAGILKKIIRQGEGMLVSSQNTSYLPHGSVSLSAHNKKKAMDIENHSFIFVRGGYILKKNATILNIIMQEIRIRKCILIIDDHYQKVMQKLKLFLSLHYCQNKDNTLCLWCSCFREGCTRGIYRPRPLQWIP